MPSSAKSETKTNKTRPHVEVSCGNVFADLGLAEPELALVKAQLIMKIDDLMTETGLTLAKAAKLFGLDQPKLSELLRGRTGEYTTDCLFKFLNLLGQQIDITIRPIAEGGTVTPIRVVPNRTV